VADALIRGLQRSKLKCECIFFPVGDGGDGTGALLANHLGAKKISIDVKGPLGDLVSAPLYMSNDHTAIVELADASGLRLVAKSRLNPMASTTYGTGELIRHALDQQASEIILAVGGSATVDGGAGILRALGVRFLDSEGAEVVDLPSGLCDVTDLDISKMDHRILETGITILCDVVNPIGGPNGSAHIFGPQKGASPSEVLLLERALRNFCDVINRQFSKVVHELPGGGAAGGVAAVLHALCKARLVSGIEYFLRATNFDQVLRDAELVITGEGLFDDQTFEGKAPMGVAKRAFDKGIKVIAVAGDIAISDRAKAEKYFSDILSMKKPGRDLKEALAATFNDLEEMGVGIGNGLAFLHGGGRLT
jgi:glycerate 2-kinase